METITVLSGKSLCHTVILWYTHIMIYNGVYVTNISWKLKYVRRSFGRGCFFTDWWFCVCVNDVLFHPNFAKLMKQIKTHGINHLACWGPSEKSKA